MAVTVNDDTKTDSAPYGLLTRTIIPSPVVRWILPIRLRHRSLNDIVFVGEDFIEVKQVRRGGHVDHVISKHDFGSRICAANVFTIDDPAITTADDLVLARHEISFATLEKPTIPAQLLVLTLAAPAVMFLYVAAGADGTPVFRHQLIQTPRWPNALDQTGEHLAIDPQSRAMAVASRGGKMILYSAKDKEVFKNELENNHEAWCPVTQEKAITDESPISQMAFLQPKRQDTDHVYLLLVVNDLRNRRTKLKWIDWRVSLGIKHLQTHDQIPLDAPRCVPTLLIPLCNTNFILVYGQSVRFYKDLLSGTPTNITIDNLAEGFPPIHPGISPKNPLWINWCRPMRSPNAVQDRDSIYLCREDGQVFLVDIQQDGTMHASSAGNLECHVGEAFASLGDDMNPDLLAVAADMSTGRIVSIGNWSSHRAMDLSRRETMDMKLVELIPNWASVTDMTLARIHSSHSRASVHRDSLFVSSGRQPYGKVSEIRKGLEARMIYYFDLPGLNNTLDVWTLPDPPTGAIILLLTTPDSTDVYLIEGTPEGIDISSDPGVFSTSHRTIAAGITRSNLLVQVTERKIIVAAKLHAGFEDKDEKELGDDARFGCTVVNEDLGLVVACEQKAAKTSLRTYVCHTYVESDNSLSEGPSADLDHEVLCMAAITLRDEVFILAASADDGLLAYMCNGESIRSVGRFTIEVENPARCDQMKILQTTADDFLVICGLADGRLVTFPVSISPEFHVGKAQSTRFGHSTVKLISTAAEVDRVFAMCGTDTCLVRLDPSSPSGIVILSIWAADKDRPDLAQTHISACTRIPDSTALSREGGLSMLGSSLVMLSANELWIASLGSDPLVVARQLSVKGSPFRLIYARAQRYLVCASIVTEPTENHKRRCYPHIDFLNPKDGRVVAEWDMEPGEEVYSLLEWSPESSERDKSYLFVLVGTKYVSSGASHEVKGRVHFLRKQKDNVSSQHTLSLDSPVYALALYDKLTFAVCYGRYLRLYRFSFEERKVHPICHALDLATTAASVSCRDTSIFVTTRDDSLVVVRVTPSQKGDSGSNVESYQLKLCCTGPRADAGVSHAILPATTGSHLGIMTTTECEVIGLETETSQGKVATAAIKFEARLPQSITKLRLCDVRPAWRSESSQSILHDGIVGCCTDGSLIGIAVIDESLWRRLFWLQRLCEWDPLMSPHTYERPPYTVGDADLRGTDRASPIGLSTSKDVMLSTPHSYETTARTMHIDGDVLARILAHGGEPILRLMIKRASERHDHVGEWIRQRLADELAEVDGCVADLRVLLNSWL